MKKLMTGVLFVIQITFIFAKNSKLVLLGSQHSWVVVITPATNKGYLDSLTAAWKKENIDLKISKLKYDARGNLVKIKGSVSITTTSESHASATFSSENLESIEIKVDDRPNVVIKGK